MITVIYLQLWWISRLTRNALKWTDFWECHPPFFRVLANTLIYMYGHISLAAQSRQISSFNPSRELPCNVEDAMLLWLNKVSEAVCRRHREEISSMMEDPDPRQRRRNRLKLVNEATPSIPPIMELCSGIGDGQCLAALLIHYAPQAAKWTGEWFAVLCPIDYVIIGQWASWLYYHFLHIEQLLFVVLHLHNSDYQSHKSIYS